MSMGARLDPMIDTHGSNLGVHFGSVNKICSKRILIIGRYVSFVENLSQSVLISDTPAVHVTLRLTKLTTHRTWVARFGPKMGQIGSQMGQNELWKQWE